MKKWLPLMMILLVLALAACKGKDDDNGVEIDEEALENMNETGMPIVEEPIELNFFAGKAPSSADDWNDVMVFNEYEEMTNIDINWEMIPHESLSEKRNLALGGGKLPDAFHSALIPASDLFKYGKQGTFIELNDLIDEYAPNFKKILEENPEVEKLITFPDGKIYAFPTIFSPDFLSVLTYVKPWVREDWLEELDMDVPETTDELYEYFKAIKEEQPDGGGEIPFGATSIDGIINWVEGSFGVANRGVSYIDMDPDEEGKVRFYPTSDEYKEMLEYVHKLYEEELIEQNIFSMEWDQYLANASEGKYGSTMFNSPEELFEGEIGESFIPGKALEGPHGDKNFTVLSSPVFSMGNFVITNENENPAATVRWMDYFYGDEGAKLFFMGIEGETFEETEDGEFEYVDDITNSKDGLSLDQELAKYFTWLGGGYPGIVKEEYFNGAEASPSEIEAAEVLEPDLIDEVWAPGFTYTEEENRVLDSTGADIEKYVNEMRDKFIAGDESFDNWDQYVSEIEKMNLDEYMKIEQDAYEKFEEN